MVPGPLSCPVGLAAHSGPVALVGRWSLGLLAALDSQGCLGCLDCRLCPVVLAALEIQGPLTGQAALGILGWSKTIL